MRRLTAIFPLLLLPCLAGCGEEQQPAVRVFEATETPTAQEAKAYRGPPPIQLVTGGGETVDAYLSSFCWKSLCADSWPHDEQLPDAGSPATIDFSFPIPETHFSATFSPMHDRCAPTYVGTVTDLGDGRYSLAPAGPPARYKVLLTGHTSSGQAPGVFFWTTPVAGDLGDPRAEISIVHKPDGTIEGGYFVVDVRDLARTPRAASAKVTVTAGNGASMSFDAGKPEIGCPQSGYVSFWRVDKHLSQEAADLGPAPFRYDVELVLDGTTHSASATWPDDHVHDPAGGDPALVPLVFDPPLPGRG